MVILLILLSVIISASATDVDYSKKSLIAYLKLLDKSIEPSIINSCSEILDTITLENCSATQRSYIIDDLLSASVMLTGLDQQIKSHGKTKAIMNNPERRDTLFKINAVVECMKKALGDELSLNCGIKCSKDDSIAQVDPITKLYKNEIALCPLYHQSKSKVRSSFLIHELSHLCGTQDKEYMSDSDGQRYILSPNEKVNWVKRIKLFGYEIMTLKSVKGSISHNADNYAYWANEGFCLPNFNCKLTVMERIYKEAGLNLRDHTEQPK